MVALLSLCLLIPSLSFLGLLLLTLLLVSHIFLLLGVSNSFCLDADNVNFTMFSATVYLPFKSVGLYFGKSLGYSLWISLLPLRLVF